MDVIVADVTGDAITGIRVDAQMDARMEADVMAGVVAETAVIIGGVAASAIGAVKIETEEAVVAAAAIEAVRTEKEEAAVAAEV